MRLHQVFDQAEHDGMVIECFLQMWRHSADLMFIMAVEDNDEFTLFDNNPASKRVMGLDADLNVHRLDIRAIFGDEVTEQVYGTYREVLQAKKPISIEQNGIRGDGSSIYFDTLFVPIYSDQGEPLFVCGVSRDITKIKEAEQVAIKANEKLKEYSYALEEINQNLDKKVQERTVELEKSKKIAEEALQTKSSFVARMSHEIRTPINAVIGLSDLALKTDLDNNQKDFICKILESGETLLELVNDVLDFSKMEAGKLLVEKIPFSIEKIIRRVCNMNSIRAEEKQLKFLCHIDEKVPKILIGDPLRIQQIIVNLTSNAIKFTDYGEVCLRITSEEYEEQGVLLQCEVSDTGMGISKEQIDRLFQSFSQADTSITRKFGGTGLGLSISQQLCELMGGQIHVSSELGVGAKFTVSLPLFSGSIGPYSTKKDSLGGLGEVENVPDLSGCRILLVDDHPINRHVAVGYLGGTKASVDIAISGLQALNKLQEEKFDLVLLDIQMPEMDGFTVAKKIRDDLKLLTLPIIAMTAHVDESSIQESYDSGMNDHIAKPVNKHVLYETLQKYLRVSIDDTKVDTEIIEVSKDSLPSEYEALFVGIKRIESIDVDKAIRNMGRMPLLYLDVVRFFYKQYSQKVDYLFKFEVGKDNDQILEFVHTLKSSAAYIGAFELSTSCSILEEALLNGNGTNAFFVSVLHSLDRYIGQLSSLFENELSQKPIPKSGYPDSNVGKLKEALIELLPLLQTSDFSAENYFDRLHSLVANTEYVSLVGELVWNVEEVEYERAAEIVQRLLAQIQGTQ